MKARASIAAARRREKLTSSGVISLLSDRSDFIVKTNSSRAGRPPIYSLNRTMRVLPNDLIEQMIGKGTLVAREASGQSFELSSKWGDPRPTYTWGM